MIVSFGPSFWEGVKKKLLRVWPEILKYAFFAVVVNAFAMRYWLVEQYLWWDYDVLAWYFPEWKMVLRLIWNALVFGITYSFYQGFRVNERSYKPWLHNQHTTHNNLVNKGSVKKIFWMFVVFSWITSLFWIIFFALFVAYDRIVGINFVERVKEKFLAFSQHKTQNVGTKKVAWVFFLLFFGASFVSGILESSFIETYPYLILIWDLCVYCFVFAILSVIKLTLYEKLN